MARIQVIEYEESSGILREIYDEVISKRRHLAEVHKVQSLRPESIRQHIDLYMEIMFSRSTLSRAEREMMAVVVSAANECEYCQIHHGDALNQYWKDEGKLEKLKKDFINASLTKRELVLCEFAKKLTLRPGRHSDLDPTLALREAGVDESGILDAALVVSYFNFVNRIVLSMGVELENERK